MEVLAILVICVCLFCFILIPFIPKIIEKQRNKETQRFYDSINVGDGFEDPYYSDDPFSAQYRVLEVIAKKDNYILYEINWYDVKTNLKAKGYTPRKESCSVERFFYLVKDYRKVTVFN